MATKLTKKNTKKVQPVKTAKVSKPTIFTRGLGRRKTSVARVRVFTGRQEVTINNKPASSYWADSALQKLYLEPFRLTNTLDHYTATALIKGGGAQSQVDAFVHGLARALASLDPEKNRKVLKEHGFLTRDPRMKESRKVGQGGRARFKKQSPKR